MFHFFCVRLLCMCVCVCLKRCTNICIKTKLINDSPYGDVCLTSEFMCVNPLDMAGWFNCALSTIQIPATLVQNQPWFRARLYLQSPAPGLVGRNVDVNCPMDGCPSVSWLLQVQTHSSKIHGHLMQNIFTYLHLASSVAFWLHIRGPSSKIIHSFTYDCLAKSDVSFSPHLAIISRPLFQLNHHYMQPSRASIFISSW